MSITISPKNLTSIVKRMLMAAGSVEAEASIIASNLVRSNQCGHDSHGVGYLPEYIRTAKNGKLIPNQKLKIINDTGAILVCSGERGYGQVMGKHAMDLGIERAKQLGLCAVSLKNAHHLGRIGSFAEQCTDAGFASIHFTNVSGHSPLVAPYRGGASRLGTNPLTMSFPAPKGKRPIVLDMATSMVALGKVRNAFQSNQMLPPGLVIDNQGKNSQDPSVMFPNVKRGETSGATTEKGSGGGSGAAGGGMGALLSAALHKGYGLALMCELFGAVSTGGQTIAPHHERPPCILNSMFTIIFNPVLTSGGNASSSSPASSSEHLEAIYREVELLEEYVKSVPIRGEEDVEKEGLLFPGERAARKTSLRRDSLQLDPGTWSSILGAASSLGIREEVLSMK
jgi:hydroxycarboxylate dehydrogenase B